MISTTTLFRMKREVEDALRNYVIDKAHVGDDYHVARVWLSQIFGIGYRDIEIANQIATWARGGSTLALIQLLSHVKYDDSLLVHFNAFSLLDTISIKFKKQGHDS